MLPLQIPSTVLALLSLLLLVAALSSEHWLEARRDGVFVHSGLWKICANSVCAMPLKLPDYIEATKTFLILGLLAGLLSAFSLLALLSGSGLDTVSPLVVSAVGSFSAGFCVLIALTVFTSEFAEVIKVTWPHISFGWSWGLGWASIPLFLLTGGVTLLAQESNSI
ncbi:protein NKG7-like [Gopherus flavomarginatus]|uniref:protein NKG7-like n=1 Tax=Gopherus flavomarginatus TaxID=286002 RepID=UPI0021CC4A3A|nr:protein NKG7-like [Gopherus flavomarginatus]